MRGLPPAPVIAIVEDAPLKVSRAVDEHVQAVDTLTVDAPRVKERVALPFPVEKVPHVTVLPLVSKVPAVKVIFDVPLFKLSCNVHPPPIPLKVIRDAVVIVSIVTVFPVVLERKFIAPVNVLVIFPNNPPAKSRFP